MSEILSQQEIDQLLASINSGELKEEQLSNIVKHKEIYEYDFRRPTRVSKDQLKTIRTLHENFSEIFGFYLASRLQTMATIDLLAVDQLRYSEYVLSISNPSCIYIFNIVETEGKAVLEMTPELVFVIVERLLGGHGGKPSATRGITAIEQRMMQPIMRQALTNLSQAWRPVQQLTLNLVGFESNPDFVQIAPASEIVIVISFEIKIGEESFLMNICYPSFALEDIIARLNIQYFSSVVSSKDKQQSLKKITSHLEATTMEVRALLGQTEITIRELLELEIGDVLRLDNRIGEAVPVFVEDRLKFWGHPGILNNKLAIQIDNMANEKI